MSEPVLSALVSTYAAERYLRGCLDSLLAQSLGPGLEIVVVDACSPEGEGAIVREYQRTHPNIRYLRTETREKSSLSFQRATALARGRYLTTANADDRHHPEFAARMCTVLEEHPEFGIVYADSLITQRDNETFFCNTATKRYAWPDYTHTTALSCCLFGAQPVWRRALHDAIGTWDPDLHFANDHDLFLRISLRFGAVHLRQALGLFLMRPDSVSGAANRKETLQDVLRVMRKYRSGTPLEVLFPGLVDLRDDPEARAAAWIELGNLAALGPYTDGRLALDCYRRAVDLPLPEPQAQRVRDIFACNSACILACAGDFERALRALALCEDRASRSANESRICAAVQDSIRPHLQQMVFAELPHPVITQSRTTRGLGIDSSGATAWTAWHAELPWQVFEGPNGTPIRTEETAGSVLCSQPARPPSSKGPHVLVVMYGWAESGGGTMLPRDFALALASRGKRVSVLYAGARPRPDLPAYGLLRHQEGGVALHGLFNRPALFMDPGDPGREIDDPRIRELFGALLEELRPDLVHFWNLHNLGLSLPAECKRRGLPTVFSSNNYWPICPRLYLIGQRLERCEGATLDGTACARCLGTPGSAKDHARRKLAGIRMLREHIDVHLAVSKRVRELYVQNGDDPEHVRVLRQEPSATGVLWEKVGSRRAIVDRLARPLRVGFLGSVMAHKGVHVLAQALQALPEGAVECLVLGDRAPDYMPVLARIDAKQTMHFFGRYDQELLVDLLAKFDVMVVPSVWDDCAPFVVAEALAARCPVVGSRIGGIPDFVTHGKNGLLFEPGSALDLAQCLASFLRDPCLLGTLQQGIEPPRGLEAFTTDLLEVYATLLPGKDALVSRGRALKGSAGMSLSGQV